MDTILGEILITWHLTFLRLALSTRASRNLFKRPTFNSRRKSRRQALEYLY